MAGSQVTGSDELVQKNFFMLGGLLREWVSSSEHFVESLFSGR